MDITNPQNPQPTPANPSIKHWAILILTAAIVGASLVCYALKPQVDDLNPVVKHQESGELKDWKIYKNEDYGFELTLTDAWEGYRVSDSLIFKVPNEYGGEEGHTGILYLAVWPEERYEAQNEPNYEGLYWDLLGKKDGKAIVHYGHGQDPPPNIERYEIQKVLSTFKFSSQTDTSGWKTYVNSDYGFEFKYPEDFLVTTAPSGVIEIARPHGDTEFPGVWLNIYKNSNNLTAKQWWQQQKGDHSSETIENAIISSQDGIKVSSTVGFQEKDYIVAYNQNIYRISRIGLNDALFNQILSTFKFTAQMNTSSWETYTNTEYGFELKYPDDSQLITNKSKAQGIGFVYGVCGQNALACFAYAPDKFAMTNFNGAGLSVNLAVDKSDYLINSYQGCKNYSNFEDTGEIKTINGIEFHRYNSGDGAGGHMASVDSYVTFFNGNCFEIKIDFETISAYSELGLNEMTNEMNQSLTSTFEQIFSTFKFTK